MASILTILKKRVNVPYNAIFWRLRESLLPWKSNKYYLLVGVCMRVRARACVRAYVNVGIPARGRVHAHKCM